MMARPWIIDPTLTAAVAERQECADLTGGTAVVKAAEQTLGHKTREEVRKYGGLTSPSTPQRRVFPVNYSHRL